MSLVTGRSDPTIRIRGTNPINALLIINPGWIPSPSWSMDILLLVAG